ncbi:hypothetical protein [Aeromonas dhakensis]|uniref:hypothetical protein n=1 Tax=Aeromonas dhakensis TaxID=196024 RepID=UPI003426F6AA
MPRQLAEDAKEAIEKVEFGRDDYHKNRWPRPKRMRWLPPRRFDESLDDDDWDMKTMMAWKSSTCVTDPHPAGERSAATRR